jgi:hypothetical protein
MEYDGSTEKTGKNILQNEAFLYVCTRGRNSLGIFLTVARGVCLCTLRLCVCGMYSINLRIKVYTLYTLKLKLDKCQVS